MGMDLSLKKNNEIIDLGRSHYYKICNKIPTDINDAYIESDKILIKVKLEINKIIAYSPKNLDELNEINEDINNLLDDFQEEIFRCGKSSVITEIIGEGFEVLEG